MNLTRAVTLPGGSADPATTPVEATDATELLLRQALESIDDGFAIFDADDRLVMCNRRLRTMTPGLADVLVPGVTFRELLEHSVRLGGLNIAPGRENEWIEHRMRAHRDWSQSIERQNRDGRWLQTREMPIANGGVVLIRTDVTELKRREMDLEKSRSDAERAHRRLIDAIQSLPDALVYYDESDRLVAFNDAYLATYSRMADKIRSGLSFTELAGMAWDSGLVQEAGADKASWLAERLETHRNPGPPIERSVGGDRWLRILERRTSEGGYVTLGTDITEAKAREQALRDSEERFASYFQHSPEALFVVRVEPGGRFVYEARNPAHRAAANISDAHFLGKTPEQCLTPELAQQFVGHYRDCLAAGAPQRFLDEIDISRGPEIWDTTLVPMRDAKGNIVRLLGSARNVTEQRRIETELIAAKEQAEASNRAKSNFLANMSHELRTPLNAVIGFSEIIASELLGRLGTPKYIEYAEDIQRSGRHLLELINDILDMSRIEAGRYQLAPEDVSPGELIGEVVRLVSVNAAQAGVWLINNASSDLPKMRIDRRAVRQVLLNLLSNAIKFTPKGGSVTVDGNLAPERLLISVEDTGIGIAENDLTRLAKPFEQVDNVMTRRQEGSGLGLAISKALIELHGGTLIIDSALGRGTKVTVTLPL
ncbi:MAG TPA: PAS-domain containing protein [Candidatus Cybelea sp.]|nr:PAS-domain containing protein [Candidatus Cybelea sp.]